MTTKLNDDKIVEIAKKTDELILQIGKDYEPSGIELAAIMLGRLMVFTQQTGNYTTFHDMMKTIVNMGEPPEEKS